jgi:putative redox protein
MPTTPVTLRSRGSFRTEVEAGPHRFVLDEPVDAGGGGEGPTPYDMLASALGGCTAMTLHKLLSIAKRCPVAKTLQARSGSTRCPSDLSRL